MEKKLCIKKFAFLGYAHIFIIHYTVFDIEISFLVEL